MRAAEQLVDDLLEDEDVDWSPDPSDPDVPADLNAYADSAYTVMSALKLEGFEREPGEFWYLAADLDHTPLGDGRIPQRLQIVFGPRFVKKFNDLSVWFYYSYPGGGGLNEYVKTLVSMHQRADKTDEHFVPVIHAMATAVRATAARTKSSDYPDFNSYTSAVTKQLVSYIPANYRDHSAGFLHYAGRAE